MHLPSNALTSWNYFTEVHLSEIILQKVKAKLHINVELLEARVQSNLVEIHGLSKLWFNRLHQISQQKLLHFTAVMVAQVTDVKAASNV